MALNPNYVNDVLFNYFELLVSNVISSRILKINVDKTLLKSNCFKYIIVFKNYMPVREAFHRKTLHI